MALETLKTKEKENISFDKCKNEQEFKMLYVNKILKPIYKHVFCIETEETVRGFPDVLCIDDKGKTVFYEFKYANNKGKIKFQPTQPAFYRVHSDLHIAVVAYNPVKKESVLFSASCLFNPSAEIRMSEKGEVQL